MAAAEAVGGGPPPEVLGHATEPHEDAGQSPNELASAPHGTRVLVVVRAPEEAGSPAAPSPNPVGDGCVTPPPSAGMQASTQAPGATNWSARTVADEGAAVTTTPSQVEAQARLVRQHEEEVLMEHFRRWIVLFSMVVCLATPTMISLLIWLVVAYMETRRVECAVPLRTWVYVVCGIVAYNSTVNRPTPTGSCVQRVFCRWRRDPTDPQPAPLRVRLYNFLITVFVFSWNCAGLHWIRVDGSLQTADLPACKDAEPELYTAVKVYAAFNLAITLFMYVNMFGFHQLLRIALRRGLLHTSHAAPAGSLEKNTEVANMSDPSIAENPSCSICLDEFDEGTTFVKTKHCGHLFHQQCLKGWLQVNRTCPLCREDLGTSNQPSV